MRVALLLMLLSPSLVQAEGQGRRASDAAGKPLAATIGEQVVTRFAKPLKIGDGVADDGAVFRVYRVAQVNGDWLWLVSGQAQGWVAADDVVPLSQAVEHFTSQIAVRHKAASAYVCRGIVLQAKGQRDAAIADFSKAIGIDPKLALAYYNRGLAWQENRDLDKAIADYGEAIRLDPKDARAYRARARAWRVKQDYEQALADYDSAIRLAPKHALGYRHRGLVWYAKRDFDKALADFNEALRLDPQSAAAYNNRAGAWHMKEDYGQAVADYDSAIRLAPDDPLAYDNLARLCAACPDATRRDATRAVELATRACELTDWNDWRYVQTLAAVCAAAGDFDQAARHGELAFAIAPVDAKQRTVKTLEGYKARVMQRERAVD